MFGSQAKDRARADSDVDLAVLCSSPQQPPALFELAQRLASLLACDVDLVDLARASTVMKKEIVAGGRTLYEQSPATRHAFEGQVLSAYARLNEERRPILERIRREGRVHG